MIEHVCSLTGLSWPERCYITGVIDAIFEGGRLISIPVLLMGGLSSAQAIAANKRQGAVILAHYYLRKGVLSWCTLGPWIIGAVAGGGLGTLVLSVMGNALLSKFLPMVLIIMAFYFAFAKSAGDHPTRARLSHGVLGGTLISSSLFTTAFWDQVRALFT